jgi:2-keto-4-pentenoate hydratase
VSEIHPSVTAAVSAQLQAWRAALGDGAGRVGWKVAHDIAEIEDVAGDQPVIGHLTTASLVEDGGRHSAAGARKLRAETELVLEIGDELTIASFAVALELVDVARPPDDLEGIVAANAFHRALALGPAQRGLAEKPEGRALVNGELRQTGTAREDHTTLVQTVARQLDAVGERLRPGDRILTGSITHVPVRVRDVVTAEIDGLGGVEVEITP